MRAHGGAAPATLCGCKTTIVAMMRTTLLKALKTKNVADVHGVAGMAPLDLVGDDLDKFQRAELERWGKAVRAANLTPQK